MTFTAPLNEKILSVIEACAREWECPVEEMTSRNREFRATVPRHAAMKIMRTMGMSLHEVAGVFSRHHTAVVNAVKRHGERMESKSYAEKFRRASA